MRATCARTEMVQRARACACVLVEEGGQALQVM